MPQQELDLTSSLKFSEMKKSADAEETHVAAISAKAENFMVCFGCFACQLSSRNDNGGSR